MKIYVAAFPNLGVHARWIDEFRSKHDPAAKFIRPHVTLVFPTSALSLEELQVMVAETAREFVPFRVILRSAMVVPDIASQQKHAHIFLVPSEGFDQILRLHDCLYAGRLRRELRLEIPYIPHLTIGAEINLVEAKSLANQINVRDFQIEFELRELCIGKVMEREPDCQLISPIPLG